MPALRTSASCDNQLVIRSTAIQSNSLLVYEVVKTSILTPPAFSIATLIDISRISRSTSATMSLSDPFAGVPREMAPHVHLLSGARLPHLVEPSLETIAEFLVSASKLMELHAVKWTYLNAPPEGALLLVWQNHSDFASDGYVYRSPEQSFGMGVKGYAIETRVRPAGFQSPNEAMASMVRRRYHIVGSPNHGLPFDPNLWIVHYAKLPPQEHFPVNRIPITPQIQHSLSLRRALQSYGPQLLGRKFLLRDRSTWPVLTLPPQLQSSRTPSHSQPSQAGTQSQPSSTRHQSMSANGTNGTLGLNAFSMMFEDEEVSTGDLLDNITQRDISRIRYKYNHEWMEEIFASPYRSDQIIPVDLGLGRKGELAALTSPFFMAPTTTALRPRRSENEKEEPAPYIGRLPPGKAEEFASAVKAKIAETESEMENMREEHAKKIAKLQQLRKIGEEEMVD